MATLTIYDKIDIVLSIFKPDDYKLENEETKKTIQKKLLNEKHLNIDERLLVEILSKLEDSKYLKSVSDGHIRRNEIDYYADPKIYTLTFDGEIFLIGGGYNGEIQRQTNPLRKLKTGLINAAAVTAGAYYLFEIIRIYIVPVWIYYLNTGQFVWQK